MDRRHLLLITALLACGATSLHADDRQRGQRPEAREGREGRDSRERSQGISLDQAVERAQRTYRARVIRADVADQNGRRTYVLRMLSEDSRVWTVRVDAATGEMR